MVDGTVTNERSLKVTPTWAVATVVTVFVAISFIIVKAIEKLEKWMKKWRKKALLEALYKMKEELMLLGFISLLLTVFQNNVASICIKSDALERFSLCKIHRYDANNAGPTVDGTSSHSPASSSSSIPPESSNPAHHRRSILQNFDQDFDSSPRPIFRRFLAENGVSRCHSGYESFVSVTGLHQLHTLIFVLALVHVLYSVIAMGLAMLKVRGWKSWEEETRQQEADTLEKLTELTRSLTLRRQNTFLRYHTSKPWSRNRVFIWVLCFFRQFGQSVTRADYLSLRLGFISSHKTGLKFNFYRYMIRSMEDEFKTIVGITAWLWAFVVIFLLFNVNGTNLYFWMSFLPVVLVLLVGCKLQHVISTLALEQAGMQSLERNASITVTPSDELFWFNRPGFLLWLIHFILFQNAFELATFIWFIWQFGFKSCLFDKTYYVYIRIVVGLLTQFLCSYSTLPLYALVTQMGSNFKKSILSDEVKDKLQLWRKNAKRKIRNGKSNPLGDESSKGSTVTSSMVDDNSSWGSKTKINPMPEPGSTHNHSDDKSTHEENPLMHDRGPLELSSRDFLALQSLEYTRTPPRHSRIASESYARSPIAVQEDEFNPEHLFDDFHRGDTTEKRPVRSFSTSRTVTFSDDLTSSSGPFGERSSKRPYYRAGDRVEMFDSTSAINQPTIAR